MICFLANKMLACLPTLQFVWTSRLDDVRGCVDDAGCGSWPLIICSMGQSMFQPRKMSHSFIQICCWITLQVSHHQRWKTCVKIKYKVKLIFRGAYRLSATGIVECLEFIDVGCKLKQFDDFTWLTLTPRHVLRQLYATGRTYQAIAHDIRRQTCRSLLSLTFVSTFLFTLALEGLIR